MEVIQFVCQPGLLLKRMHMDLVLLARQSSEKSLTIRGAGFKGEPVLNFDPPIWSPANYTLTVVSEEELQLDLVAGSMWHRLGGHLIVKAIRVGDDEVCEFLCSTLPYISSIYSPPPRSFLRQRVADIAAQAGWCWGTCACLNIAG